MDSDFYDLPGFIAGKTSLNEIELNELGDVSGKKLLHLQCHFGQDTLSWAREGATVTGVDLSETAIEEAKKLSDQINVPAAFVRSNLYDLPENLDGEFDIIFTSYGTIGWLPDLDKWAEVIVHFLKPGGTFYIAEFHPVVWMFSDDFSRVQYAYHNDGVISETYNGTYADPEADITNITNTWNHSLSEVMMALINAGLKIESFHEFDYSPYNCFQNTVKTSEGNYQIKGMEGLIPMVYSLKATIPG